ASVDERDRLPADAAADGARQQHFEQRRDQAPGERHRAQLDDHAGEEEPLPQPGRLGGLPAQSSVCTRWLEVAKIHEMPKPAVRLFSRRTSGLGAKDAPWTSS